MREFEDYRDRLSASEQAADLATKKEHENALALSQERVRNFIDFMQANGEPGTPVVTLDLEEVGYFRVRYTPLSGKPKGLVPVSESEARNTVLPRIRHGYTQVFNRTYTPVGNGWLVLAPTDFNHFDIIDKPGYIVLDDGSCVWISGGHIPEAGSATWGEFDRLNITPPEDALLIPAFNEEAARHHTMFASDEHYRRLLEYAAHAVPVQKSVQQQAPAPKQYFDPRNLPVYVETPEGQKRIQ